MREILRFLATKPRSGTTTARRPLPFASDGLFCAAKAQVGDFGRAAMPPKRARSVPERGFVAKKWPGVCTELARRLPSRCERMPSPSISPHILPSILRAHQLAGAFSDSHSARVRALRRRAVRPLRAFALQ
ncbi:hypothetical protein B5F40_13790 [Gordonibacter sp. An230]|nr:hypothetical protein B5F40_13790 [Gordonibacter sp. An230]